MTLPAVSWAGTLLVSYCWRLCCNIRFKGDTSSQIKKIIMHIFFVILQLTVLTLFIVKKTYCYGYKTGYSRFFIRSERQ